MGEIRESMGFEDKGRLGSGQEQGRIRVLTGPMTHTMRSLSSRE